MYKDTSWKRKYLSLVLQTAERGRENQTVIVAFELCSVVMTLGMSVFLPKAFV
jgi:hypothetical protein